MWPRRNRNREDDAQTARLAMVRNQLERRGITDERVLQAMREVPRHAFVPAGRRAEAYGDHPVPIGEAQTVSQPYMVAVMIEHLRLRGGERVLEIGTGSGYQAAVLSRLAAEVYTVECFPSLAARCPSRFATAWLPERAGRACRRLPGTCRLGALPRHHRGGRGAIHPGPVAGAVGGWRAVGHAGRRFRGAAAGHPDPASRYVHRGQHGAVPLRAVAGSGCPIRLQTRSANGVPQKNVRL